MTADSSQKLLVALISKIKKAPFPPLTEEEKKIYMSGRIDAIQTISDLRDTIVKSSSTLGDLGINSIK